MYCFLVQVSYCLLRTNSIFWVRSWINALNHRCDPNKRMEIKNKGDTGMVKKSISKSSNRSSVLVTQSLLQAVDLLFVETTDQDSCPQVTPATHCCWSFVRSGGKNLKSSQAYTQSFADWVLKNHQVQGIPGDAWTCRGIYLGKAILSSTSLKVALNTSMCSMFTNFGAMSSLDAGKQTAHITRISKVLIV